MEVRATLPSFGRLTKTGYTLQQPRSHSLAAPNWMDATRGLLLWDFELGQHVGLFGNFPLILQKQPSENVFLKTLQARNKLCGLTRPSKQPTLTMKKRPEIDGCCGCVPLGR